MPWSEITVMDEKLMFIRDWKRENITFAELCRRYQISRKTGYKWTGRFDDEGVDGLRFRSHAALTVHNKTSPEVEDAIVTLRLKHRAWGAKKLEIQLAEKYPGLVIPARSTICNIFDRNGLILKKSRRRKIGHPGRPTTKATAPNISWSADFKGQFKTKDGKYCYPLTVTDNYSRYILACEALTGTTIAECKPVFTRLFKQFGLPDRIRTDNGPPFASTALARLSRLSAWWVTLGIRPEVIEPGKPQQNGRHERMHRTLKAETTKPPAANLTAQQRKFNAFTKEFNEERPHEAIQMKRPANLYEPSKRKMPLRIKKLEYPPHFEIRYVSKNSGIRWNGKWVPVSNSIVQQYVGLEEVDYGIWDVYFGPIKLGRLHESLLRIEDHLGRLKRKKEKR